MDIYKIKYVGEAAETTVMGFGVFRRDNTVACVDPAAIEKGKNLVKHNPHFQEVK